MLVPQTEIAANVKTALAEDIGSGDLTADLIPKTTRASAQLISREHAILAGTAWFDEVFKQSEPDIKINWYVKDGDAIKADTVLCKLAGPARPVLSGERTAINFLQSLSGTATVTALFVDLIKGTQVKLLDTRKTIPGLRRAQKYAVRCGGGMNHRIGLYDAVLIKENHSLAAGGISRAIQQAKKTAPMVEVEVENLQELEQAITAGADQILLDNFTIADLAKAVAINQDRARLEASGNVNKQNIRAIAETGIDFISIGALTKHVNAIDFSMRITTTKGG